MNFYVRVGLEIEKKYITTEEKVEFATFTSPEDFVYAPPAPHQSKPNDDILKNSSPTETALSVRATADEEVKADKAISTLTVDSQFGSASTAVDSPLQVSEFADESIAGSKLGKTPTLMAECALNSEDETSSSSE